MPEISVVIPTFNRSQLVLRAIRSVLSQTFNDFEVIVIDDGSPADTADVIRELGSKVKYIWQENQGVATARNLGVSVANGNYISFLDSDDVFSPLHLELLHNKISISPTIDIVHGWAQVVAKNGKRYQRLKSKLRGNVFHKFLYSNPLELGTMLIRRRCFSADTVFDPSLAAYEDWDLWLRLSVRYQFDYVPQIISTIYFLEVRRSTNVEVSQVEDSIRTIYAKLRNDPIASKLLKSRFSHMMSNVHVLKSHHYRIFNLDLNLARREAIKAIKKSPLFPRGYIALVQSCFGAEFTDTLRKWRSTLLGLGK